MIVNETLKIESLTVQLDPKLSARPLLDRVSLTVQHGETVGLVGESGSGKSVTSRAVLGLYPPNAVVSGQILLDGEEVLMMNKRRLRSLRSHGAAMIFQDARSGINPVRRIRDFLTEGLVAAGSDPRLALDRGTKLLESVGIRDPQRVLKSYPHQLSGGMLQRIMISAALAGDPSLVLADESTTALDVTTQAEVISIMEKRRAEVGAAMLFVTHNLDLAAAICSRIYVMYAGRIMEHGTVEAIFAAARHPYTRALIASIPQLDSGREITAIPGRSLSLSDRVVGCPFASRCPIAQDRCFAEQPLLREVEGHMVACHRAEEVGAP